MCCIYAVNAMCGRCWICCFTLHFLHGIVCCDMVAVHADLYAPLDVSNIVFIVQVNQVREQTDGQRTIAHAHAHTLT